MFTILGLSDISEPAVHAGPIIAASFPPKTATPSEESNTLYIDSAVSDHDATVDVQLCDEQPPSTMAGMRSPRWKPPAPQASWK